MLNRSLHRSLALGCAAFVLGAAMAIGADAHACDPASNATFEIDPDAHESDDTPPGGVIVDVAQVELDEEAVGSDCSGLDRIALSVQPELAADAADELGYLIEPVSGDTLPLATVPLIPLDGQLIILPSISEGQEQLHSVVSVRAVDRAGNAGPASEVVIDGEVATGCSMTTNGRGASSCAVAVALALLGLIARRRA
jgi:hypothetical protein